MMTWFSRLLPTDRGLRRRARAGDPGRLHNRDGRRRTIHLERLESRTVLSNVTASVTSTGALTITGDIFNDSFSVTESSNGYVKVAPIGYMTTVNRTHLPWSTNAPVTSITINLPGTTNFDTINMTGPGPTTATPTGNITVAATGANLTLTATGFDTTGSLTISNSPGRPAGNDAALQASVDNCTFPGGISITQTGAVAASVELGNDSTANGISFGPVTVSEGVGNGDTITLDQAEGAVDKFGVTTLVQGAGPAYAGAIGTGDAVTANNASLTSLAVSQGVSSTPFLAGSNNSITINTLAVAQTSFGVTTAQGNGAGATTRLTKVTAPLPTTSLSVTPSVLVAQGSGTGDSASVTNSTVPGSISITQVDPAASPGDSATLLGDAVGYTLKSGSQVTQAFAGNLSISQGHGSVDTATISNSTATGSVAITQGNGGGGVVNGVPQPGDSATVSGVKAGTVLGVAPYFYGGNITIAQGTGSGDSATVINSTAVDSVSITQVDVAGNPKGDAITVSGVNAGATLTAYPASYGSITIGQGGASGDSAIVGTSTAVGNVVITQGAGSGDAAVVSVATAGVALTSAKPASAYGGNIAITQGSGSKDTALVGETLAGVAGPVTALGNVTIIQGGGNGDAAAVSSTTAGIVLTAASPVSAYGGNIAITQGSGSKDTALVGETLAGVAGPVTALGNVAIIQTDVSGNTGGNTAAITQVTAGYTTKTGNKVTQAFAGNLSISQGHGSVDTATISNSTATGSVAITQGNGGGGVVNGVPQPGDSATVSGVKAGTVLGVAPYFYGGNITIAQGTGSGDSATVINSTAVDSVSITQNDLATNPKGDTALVSGVTAGVQLPVTPANYGNITITQGKNKGDIASVTNSTAVGKITVNHH